MWIGDKIADSSVGASNACLLNKEYKTNEYHLGRPVYCKMLKITATASLDCSTPIGESNTLDKWIAYGYWTKPDSGYYDLYHKNGIENIFMSNGVVAFRMIQGHYLAGWTAYFMLKYTKSTDQAVTA